MLAAPFVTHLANLLGAVPAPEPPTGSLKRQERRLANGGPVRTDRHQCCHRAAVTRDDRRPALLGGGQKIRKLIAGLFSTFALHRLESPLFSFTRTVQNCTEIVNRQIQSHGMRLRSTAPMG